MKQPSERIKKINGRSKFSVSVQYASVRPFPSLAASLFMCYKAMNVTILSVIITNISKIEL